MGEKGLETDPSHGAGTAAPSYGAGSGTPLGGAAGLARGTRLPSAADLQGAGGGSGGLAHGIGSAVSTVGTGEEALLPPREG
jgi:hypothetical protein